MIDVRGSGPSDLPAGLHLRGVLGTAGSILVASDGIRIDVGHGAVGLEVCCLSD